ncbi:MAG: hypothetical protein HZC40_12330 [Chloroflexi bacterium]|nr:hypothetical protein [Chloroflexota bacterium]
MSTTINLKLPDEVYRRADRLAHLAGRSIDDVLETAIELALAPLTAPADLPAVVEGLSNDQVLALSERRMNATQDQRLSVLLARQQSGALADDERFELTTLMQIYQEGWLRQAQALRESVRRGLQKPLAP